MDMEMTDFIVYSENLVGIQFNLSQQTEENTLFDYWIKEYYGEE